VVAKEINDARGEVRIPIGWGTGIDSKKDKRMVLHLPVWFYDMLRTYAHSQRAIKRRQRAKGGDTENQYLFLSLRGAPFYQSKEDARKFDETNDLHHVKSGQGVRQFITEKVFPFIRKKYGVGDYRYQFHDTRATAGMNWTDHQLQLVELGKITLHQAREFVKVRMGHESSATTDLYLQYRQNLIQVRWAGLEYESHLKQLSEQAMEGLL
jgi:integrase